MTKKSGEDNPKVSNSDDWENGTTSRNGYVGL